MKATIMFCVTIGLLSSQAAFAASVINEPTKWEDFVNHDIRLDDAAIFSGESFSAAAGETVYYISASGKSGNSGLSPDSPWDLAACNAHKADNSIYLFKRGDQFRGFISRKSDKLNTKFGAYGAGTRPLFLGSIVISGWQKTADSRIAAAVRGQVYEADLSGAVFGGTDGGNGVRHLFFNRKLMTIARYPNVAGPEQVNWLNITEKTGDYSFYDTHLAGRSNTAGYWTGATLRARTYSWQYSVRQVTGYSSGIITTESVSTPWYPVKGWGYFLDNKIEELDYPGEWFYDPLHKKIFFYPPQDTNISASLAEGMTHDTGINIYWQQHQTSVKDLSFKQYIGNCVNINSSNQILLANVATQHCGQGVYIYNANDSELRGNHIDGSFETGINIAKHENILVAENIISNNGMYPTYGSFSAALTQGKGINSLNDGVLTISGNTIVNSSYSGIEIGTTNALVEKNFIQGSLLHINDGGAIVLRGSNMRILNNIIIGVYGNINDGANGYTGNDKTSKHGSYGMGIFDYAGIQGNVISGNTAAYARDIGIMIQEGADYQISGNVSYGNEVQIQAKKGGSGISIEDNIIFNGDNIVIGAGTYADHKGLELSGSFTNLAVDRNKYGSLCSESYIFYNGGYDIDSFRHFNGTLDLNSTSNSAKVPQFSVSSLVSTLAEDDFESCENTNQWTNTSIFSGGKCSSDTSKTGSKSFVKEDATVAPTYFQLKNTVSFVKDKIYRMEFDSYASGRTIYELSIASMIDGVWTRLIPEYRFQFKSARQHHRLMFKARMDMSEQPIFHVKDGNDQQIWIDNFVLQEVMVQPKEKTKIVFDNAALHGIQSDSVLLVNKTFASKTCTVPTGYATLSGQQGSVTLAPFKSAVLIRAETQPPSAQSSAMPWLLLLQ
ncbi:NosD domain-containing protein [Candidatus Electronema sp. JC]|uniref:NosD domain-containing protein n=1 Tax=Candidatus Electronema sp. JC TaxID=3401570 RepID=UPI003B43409F